MIRTFRLDNGDGNVGFFTSGRVLRISRFLRRRSPAARGRQQALFDVVGKRGATSSTMAKESR